MDIAALWQELESTLTPIFASYRSNLESLRVELKSDKTLLSEADLAIQGTIIDCVRRVDPDGLIIAEENADLLGSMSKSGGRLWIIDPIDGTAQFVDQSRTEFCSVVCLIENQMPVAAFVLAPEIGPNRTPVCVSLTDPTAPIHVNGGPTAPVGSSPMHPRWISATRSAGTQPRQYEASLLAHGYELKTRTTSQTLDMVRACVDLAPFTDPPLEPFGAFYREQQKVWDGAAGIGLAYAAGLYVGDGAGQERTGVEVALNVDEPVFDSTLVASDRAAAHIIVEGVDRPH